MKKIVRFRYLERNDFLNKVDIKQLIKFLYSGNYISDNIRKSLKLALITILKVPIQFQFHLAQMQFIYL